MLILGTVVVMSTIVQYNSIHAGLREQQRYAPCSLVVHRARGRTEVSCKTKRLGVTENQARPSSRATKPPLLVYKQIHKALHESV